ncbi:MAG: hypothetical protein J5595_00390 [Bacteroidales bacterium]|nr:hypothetical protein [Bacteroidales bacterium]
MKETIDLEAEVKKIWSEPNLEPIPEYLRKRGYCYCNDVLRDGAKILMFGFNPSFRDDAKVGDGSFSFATIMSDCKNRSVNPSMKWDAYWSPVSEMLAYSTTINLHNETVYWDLFSYREKDQKSLRTKILKPQHNEPCKFVIEHIQLAQRIIELVKPQLIIIKNKEAWAYFGKYFSNDYCGEGATGWKWMNYMYSPVKKVLPGDAAVRIIEGIHSGNVSGLTSTNLVGTKVLFMKHINQYTKKEDRPTPEMIADLLK